MRPHSVKSNEKWCVAGLLYTLFDGWWCALGFALATIAAACIYTFEQQLTPLYVSAVSLACAYLAGLVFLMGDRIAAIFRFSASHRAAIALYHKLIPLWQRLTGDAGPAVALMSEHLGDCYGELGQHENARIHYRKAAELYARSRASFVSEPNSGFKHYLQATPSAAAAREKYRQWGIFFAVREAAYILVPLIFIAYAMLTIAGASAIERQLQAKQWADYPKAVQYLASLRKIALGEPGEGLTYAHYGDLAHEENNASNARWCYEKAVSHLKGAAASHPAIYLEVLGKCAHLLLECGSIDEASARYRQAAEFALIKDPAARGPRLTDAILGAYDDYAQSLQNRHQSAAAAFWLKRAHRLSDRNFGPDSLAYITSAIKLLNVTRSGRNVADGLDVADSMLQYQERALFVRFPLRPRPVYSADAAAALSLFVSSLKENQKCEQAEQIERRLRIMAIAHRKERLISHSQQQQIVDLATTATKALINAKYSTTPNLFARKLTAHFSHEAERPLARWIRVQPPRRQSPAKIELSHMLVNLSHREFSGAIPVVVEGELTIPGAAHDTTTSGSTVRKPFRFIYSIRSGDSRSQCSIVDFRDASADVSRLPL